MGCVEMTGEDASMLLVIYAADCLLEALLVRWMKETEYSSLETRRRELTGA